MDAKVYVSFRLKLISKMKNTLKGEKKMSKRVVKTTDYCTILQQTIIDKGTFAYGIERIIVNDGNGEEEIRWIFMKDTMRSKMQMIARPLDLPEEDLVELIEKAISEKLFSKQFIDGLKNILTK